MVPVSEDIAKRVAVRCVQCGKPVIDMATHRLTHGIKGLRFWCEICQRWLPRDDQERHRAEHASGHKEKCEQCGEWVLNMSEHSKTHEISKSTVWCDLCRKWTSEQHRVTHRSRPVPERRRARGRPRQASEQYRVSTRSRQTSEQHRVTTRSRQSSEQHRVTTRSRQAFEQHGVTTRSRLTPEKHKIHTRKTSKIRKNRKIKCGQCGKRVLHMARHMSMHASSHKIKCDVCGVEVSKAWYAKHKTCKSHKANLKLLAASAGVAGREPEDDADHDMSATSTEPCEELDDETSATTSVYSPTPASPEDTGSSHSEEQVQDPPDQRKHPLSFRDSWRNRLAWHRAHRREEAKGAVSPG
ncbi:hypothetical protein F4861DRAFT_153604 [Xylaria intraflava]|nr:hypothetical protein F4861DRAFT_153604 [Xylaria intraflava]